MARQRQLKNAPIKEAIIDFRVMLPEQITVEVLGRELSKLESDYPKKSQLIQGSVDIQMNEGQPIQTNHEQRIEGLRFASVDDAQVVQFRLNGFTFSRLEPYKSWNQMKQEAKKLWAIYAANARPEKIVRIATRYINVMPIPLPFDTWKDVLTAPPQIPDGLPQGVCSFLTRIVSKNVDIDATAIVTQVFDTIDNNHTHIILDIDVFVNQEFLPNNSECWDCLEDLRGFKNKIFFESITEKTAELFE